MECAEVRELLSEYILDRELKADVDKHLLSCNACREEVALLKELGSLKEVKAPEDFLEKVHERLARRFEFKKMARLLFFPLRIKIPLELATAVATVILAVYIFKPAEQVLRPPLITEPETVARVPVEEPVKPKEVAGPAPVLEELARLPSAKEEKPAQLAVKEKGASLPIPVKIKEDSVSKKEEEPIELVLLIKEEAPAIDYYESNALRKSGARLREEKAKKEDRQALQMLSEEEVIVEEVTSLSYLSHVHSKVKGLIEVVGGRITSVESQPQLITAEVPAKNYKLLLEKISELGSLKRPLPPVGAEDKEPIILRIRLMSSNK
ncbi:hypothetical protein KKH56_00805 [bacterium]|nr:hypothetical protein [bacterium]